jgi:hypothetical protein
MVTGYRSLGPLAKFQMAPAPSNLISSGFKKKEPRYLCLSEARASHSHKTCTEVSSSVPRLLQGGSLLNPITCRCLLGVLCPVSRQITTLACVLLKDNSRAPMARLGPEISSRVYKPVWHIPLLSVQWINSWWWIDELSETCRVSCQNKFVKLVHLVGFITKKFVTMHGHTNIKYHEISDFSVHDITFLCLRLSKPGG